MPVGDDVLSELRTNWDQFESGITADWLGTVPAVVTGGAGALLITILWAWRFPELRKAEPPRVLEMAEL